MNSFVPATGRLGQLYVESPDGEPRLEFTIEVEFEEGEFDDEIGTPFLRVSHLRAPGKSWKALEHQAWGEGEENGVGVIDATMLLFGASNPVEILQLKLGKIDPGGRVEMSMKMRVDFEEEAFRDELGEVDIELGKMQLELGPLRISTRLEKQLRGDEEATREAVAPVVDLDDYGALEKVAGGFAFAVKM